MRVVDPELARRRHHDEERNNGLGLLERSGKMKSTTFNRILMCSI